MNKKITPIRFDSNHREDHSGLTAEAHRPQLTPAQIRRSLSPDAIMSFEDGKSYKSLRPHLAKIGLSPNAYREKWGLPRDYPMVAENYSR